MNPIFLIGYMGSGKTTLGTALSRSCALQYIDLDNYIERRFHANIRDIFATRGEQAFRDIERRMLHEVSSFENTIISCGGGTPCFFDNMECMNTAGTTVWLNASPRRLWERLCVGRRRRPLIASLNDEELRTFIDAQLRERTPYYSRAHHIFDADWLDSREMISQSVTRFAEMLNIELNASTSHL